jgi:uncharacterized protein (TIRG00374 family)
VKLWRLVQVAAVLALFLFLISRTDLAAMGDALADADVVLLALAAALTLPVVVLFGVRSAFVLTKLGHNVHVRTALPVAIVGNVAGSLTPASSGEIIRGVLLRSRADVAVRDGAALVLFERGMSVYIMALTTAVAAVLLVAPIFTLPALALAATPMLFVPGIAMHTISRLLGSRRDNGTERSERFDNVRRSIENVISLTRDPALVARWSSVTIAIFGLTVTQYWLVARALADGIVFREAWVAFGASQLVGIATLLPLGLGSSDATLAALLRRFGLTLDEAASGAVLVRAVNTLPLIVISTVAYLYLQARDPGARDSDDGAAPASPHAASAHRR